jgi:hypothetical protein
VWAKALTVADLGLHVTAHGLRHAHASWLLAAGWGADLVAKERLGHGSIRTTQRFLHTSPAATTRPWLRWPPSAAAGPGQHDDVMTGGGLGFLAICRIFPCATLHSHAA